MKRSGGTLITKTGSTIQSRIFRSKRLARDPNRRLIAHSLGWPTAKPEGRNSAENGAAQPVTIDRTRVRIHQKHISSPSFTIGLLSPKQIYPLPAKRRN